MTYIKPREFVIKCEIFQTDILVYICSDVQKTIKRAARLGHVLTDKDFKDKSGLFVSTGQYTPMICIPVFDKTRYGFSTAMHEIYHAVDYLCRYNGIVFSKDTEEVRALIFSHLARQFFVQFTTNRSKKK